MQLRIGRGQRLVTLPTDHRTAYPSLRIGRGQRLVTLVGVTSTSTDSCGLAAGRDWLHSQRSHDSSVLQVADWPRAEIGYTTVLGLQSDSVADWPRAEIGYTAHGLRDARTALLRIGRGQRLVTLTAHTDCRLRCRCGLAAGRDWLHCRRRIASTSRLLRIGRGQRLVTLDAQPTPSHCVCCGLAAGRDWLHSCRCIVRSSGWLRIGRGQRLVTLRGQSSASHNLLRIGRGQRLVTLHCIR